MKQKRRIAQILWTVLLTSWLMGGFTPVWAITDEPTSPIAQLFEIHCAGCHPNGGNILRRGKTLKPKALKQNHMDSVEAIALLITNGKNNMSAFRDRLNEPQINDLSSYVLQQAELGWPKG